jgi:CubicO group peptidase (beta-lactamase class C family)
MPAFSQARRVLERATAARLFPCAVVEAGDDEGVRWREAIGRLTFDPSAPPAADDTIFDLASLTKVLATSLVAMRMVDDGRLRLDSRVADLLPSWTGEDRREVRVFDLLAHSSGLPAHRPYYQSRTGRSAYEAAIAAEPLEYAPGTRSVYSDLGFIMLGFLLEDVSGEGLAGQFKRVLRIVASAEDPAVRRGRTLELDFAVPAGAGSRVAPTRVEDNGPGTVHDENAAALGGVAGHAGLFGTVGAVGAVARQVLRSVIGPAGVPGLASVRTARLFTSRAGVPGSSRALGWDTMLPSSSCGSRMSPRAFGHTGHTGTSLWIDPEARIYVAQLTNRVYPGGGSVEDITRFRRELHDAVMTDFESSNRDG